MEVFLYIDVLDVSKLAAFEEVVARVESRKLLSDVCIKANPKECIMMYHIGTDGDLTVCRK